ncbi:MAG: C-type lectin domain-containing protein [Polyangiaceae bacterium]
MRAFALISFAALLALVVGCAIPSEGDYVGGHSPAAVDAGDGLEAGTDAGATCAGPHLHIDPSTGHCYEFVSTLLEWAPAESDCQTRGGHLVAIHDAAEQIFVGDYVVESSAKQPDGGPATSIWIGLTSSGSDGGRSDYRWSDGEPLGFRNFLTSAPTGKPCIVEYVGRLAPSWDDFECNVRDPYVCEREK